MPSSLWTSTRRIQLFNPAAEKMFQYRAADVVGKPLDMLLPERYRSKHRENVEHFRTSDQTERSAGDLGIVRGLRADGSEFPLEVAISRSTVGGKTTLTAIARDATARLADGGGRAAPRQRAISLLFEHSPLPMWVYDVESLRFLAVNDAAVADYGFGREEFLAMTIQDIRPPDELREPRCNPCRTQAGAATIWALEASAQGRHAAGSRDPLPRSRILWRRRARLVLVNDVTDRLQAEAERLHAQRAQREGEQQLAALVASLDDIVFEFDADGIYRHVWARDESLLARPRTEMLGRSIVEVLGEEAGRPFTSACQRAIQGGQPEEIEYSLEVGGGQRWFVARVSPVIDADGRRLTASMLIRDITERKAAQDALRQSTERFQRYFELGVVGMVISSPTTGMLEVNDRICGMLGYSREELLRKTWPDVTHPPDVAADLALFRQLLAGEIPSYEMEKRFVRKDGVVVARAPVGELRTQSQRRRRAVACTDPGHQRTEEGRTGAAGGRGPLSQHLRERHGSGHTDNSGRPLSYGESRHGANPWVRVDSGTHAAPRITCSAASMSSRDAAPSSSH